MYIYFKAQKNKINRYFKLEEERTLKNECLQMRGGISTVQFQANKPYKAPNETKCLKQAKISEVGNVDVIFTFEYARVCD